MSQQLRIKKYKKSRSAQKQVALPGRVEKLLKDYSLGAAGIEQRLRDFSLVAAGVGALALMTPSANADIVYSGVVDANVAVGGHFFLSLLGEPVLGIHHNSIAKGFFTHSNGRSTFVTTGHVRTVNVDQLTSAGGILFFGSVKGAPIGEGKAIPGSVVGPVFTQGLATFFGGGHFRGGAHDLLGFQFGTSHNRYNGWLGIEINQSAGVVDVVDYAYEACKGDSISAGATSGGASCSPASSTSEPNMLVLLALGAAGLTAFRLRGKTKAA
jgi:hypothetical protein